MISPRRLIVTGWTSDAWRFVAAKTSPAMARYALKHGVSFREGPLRKTSRPASWSKLIAIAGGLADYDEVLWIDSDVAVHNMDHNVFTEVPPYAAQAAVRMHCPTFGDHWNIGVWLVRRPMLPTIVEACMKDDLVHNPWWEQAAINELSETVGPGFHPLHRSWNAWRDDCGGEVRFFHACGLSTPEEKLAALEKWL